MNLSRALTMASCTDPGRVRAHNEDAVFANAACGLALLADGMGGYNAGEVASGLAVEQLAGSLTRLLPVLDLPGLLADDGAGLAALLRDEVAAANTRIFTAAHSEPHYAGMGTTLVMAWLLDNRAFVAHVGDSRLYRLRGGQLDCLTRDHSLLQEQLDCGMISEAEARVSPHRNLVTRGLGITPQVTVDVAVHPAVPGDLLLLCSDGLNDMLDDPAIARLLLSGQRDPQRLARQLVAAANAAGGRDNVSVIVVAVRRAFPLAVGRWWQALRARWA